MKDHGYRVQVEWTGNLGTGTDDYRNYSRNHVIRIDGKPDLAGSSDGAFRGDISRHNPEDMLVAALSTCHMLWYLHLCADAGIIVTNYVDDASGILREEVPAGHFVSVVLKPTVTITDASKRLLAIELHHNAHAKCFIANSVNFPVGHEPEILIAP